MSPNNQSSSLEPSKTIFAITIDRLHLKKSKKPQPSLTPRPLSKILKPVLLRVNIGYDKEVGTKGVQISGGQKQRIAIARCALNHPNIYFFDEATSALDLTTEKMVFESLNKLSQGKTTLSIAHRISTIADANKIIVFDQGRIVEEGTYQELTEQKGYFYRLERGQN